MKKLLSLLLIAALLLSLAACGAKPAEAPAPAEPPVAATEAPAATDAPAEPAAPVAEEVRGVTIPAFAVTVNGVAITQNEMAAYPMYSVQATSTNSAGTQSTVTYVGFAVKDVLAAAGLTESYVWLQAVADDGYAIDFPDAAGMIFADTTLLAMTKDGSPFKSAPWFAPCGDETTGNFLKGCVTLLVNTTEGAPDVAAPAPAEAPAGDAAPAEGLPEISDKTDKVEFAPYSFKVNGQDVTNEALAGLHIYKITVNVTNSKGVTSEVTYTGYKLADVLAACGIASPVSAKAVANDGYETELSAEQIVSDYTLVAIEKDKELGEDGTIWLAPCEATESGAYCKLVVEIIAA